MSTTLATIVIGDRGLDALTEKVNDLNKRAAKHGLEPITVTIVKTVAFVPRYSGGFGTSSLLHTVTVSGVEPCIGGWRLVAKIDFDPVLGNIVKALPGVELDPRYRTIGPVCEHCGYSRRRNNSFVLRHESGDEKVVGRNCLADFIRSGDANTIAAFADFMDRIELLAGDCEDFEEYGCGCASSPRVTTQDYLSVVSVCIRRFGWISKSGAGEWETPTATTVGCYYWGKMKTRIEFIEKNEIYPTEKDNERASAALAWAKTQVGQRSEYLHNIGKLASAEHVVWKYDGYIASILSAYAKALEFELERKALAKARTFIGNVGERLRDLPVTVIRKRFTEGYYGTKTIITMESPVGDKRAVLTWFASGDKDDDFTEGEELVVDLTVKKHESDERYGDSTIVNRVTVKQRKGLENA